MDNISAYRQSAGGNAGGRGGNVIAEWMEYFRAWLHGTFIGNVPVLEQALFRLANFATGANARDHWTQVVGGLLLAAAVYVTGRHVRPAGGWRGFLRYCFPKGLYSHPSSIVDYQITLMYIMFGYAFNVTWRLNAVLFTGLFTSGLSWMFGPAPHSLHWTGPVYAAVTILVILAEDFAGYVYHYATHRIPFLWALHKVHHSAEVLTPITASRVHPLENVLVLPVRTAFTSLVLAPVIYLFTGPPATFEIFGIFGMLVISGALGDLLLHSHVWLSWGRILNHVFLCPAMHQIHHSRAPEHWDRNFGSVFSVWDWIFGTIYIPDGVEKITYGIQGETRRLYPNVFVAWLRPFWEMVPMRARLLDAGGRLLRVGARNPGDRYALDHRTGCRIPGVSPPPATPARSP